MPTEKPRLSITVPKQYVNVLDDLVKRGTYLTRGEAIRAALMLLFKTHKIEFAGKESEDLW